MLYFLFLTVALLNNPHSEKARYRLAQALKGEGKIAEAFIEVSSLYQKNKEVWLVIEH